MSYKLPGLFIASLLFVSCTGGGLADNVFENDHLIAEIPAGWTVVDSSLQEGDWLYLEGDDGGISNITVFNLEFFVGVPNKETVEQYFPLKLVEMSFESISAEIEQTNISPWENFEVVEFPVSSKFKGLDSAQGAFAVDEYISALEAVQRRQLRRVLVFKEDEIIIIVFSVPMEDFAQKVPEFDRFLEGLNFK